jgi:hypothetical protein
MAQPLLEKPSMSTVIDAVELARREASAFGLENEVIASALVILKEEPSLTVLEAINEGINEWIK